MRVGDKAAAKKALDEHLRLYPGSWEGLNLRARYCYMMEHDWHAALRAAESLAVLYPDCWASWRRCTHAATNMAYAARAGHYFSQMNDAQRADFVHGIREALAAAERARKLNSRDADVQVELIGLYRENSMPQRAEAAFKDAIALDPGRVDAYNALAWMYRKGYENDEHRRMEILRAAVKTPDNIRLQAEIAFSALKDEQGALKLYQKALPAQGNNPVAAVHISYADTLGDLGRWDEAEEQARIALRAEANASGYLMLAQALYKLHRPKEALEAAKEAKHLDPVDPYCDAILAEVLSDLDQEEKAIRQMREAYEKDPRNVELLGEIAAAYLDRGEYDKAWRVMEEIKQQPFWEDSRINMRAVGDVHALNGHFRDAIKYYDKNLERNEGDTKTLTRSALCCMVLRDYKHAAERWRKVFAKEPNHAESHMGLALSLSMLGDRQKSAAETRKAVAAGTKVADPQHLMKERYWPEPLAQQAARLAAAQRK
jgi:tetratricopeptide (TPR) repeat protein